MCFRALFPLSLCLASWSWPETAFATTKVTNEGNLVTVWQTEDGLPQNTVEAITQTRDGFLWIGTLAGLARFDGLHFQTFDAANTPGLQDERITSLYEDSRGTLWIGHESGDVTCYRDGSFEAFSKRARPVDRVFAITEDERGEVWIFRQSGILESSGRRSSATTPSSSGGSAKMLSLTRNRAGQVWIRVEGDAAELKAGALHPLDFGPARVTSYVRGLAAANDRGLWVVSDQHIRKWVDGQWTEDRGPWGNSDISTMCELRNGALAIGTMESGFHLFYPDGRAVTFDYNHGSIQNWVRLLYEDREGNLWVAAGSGGLAKVQPTAFSMLNAPDNWLGRTVLSVTPGQDGALWIGTEGAGLYRYRDNGWSHYGEAEGFTNLYVWSITAGASGQVWAGTWNGGIFRKEGERFVRATELDPIGGPVMALHFDPADSTLWAGTGNGLLQWRDGGKIWHLHDRANSNTIVYAMAPDDHGSMWLALADAGIGRLSADGLKVLARTRELATNSAQCLLLDGDTLWIGTQNGGLNRLKNGRFSSISIEQGLASRAICHIEDDGRGYLWLSTHYGIIRVAKRELDRCADNEIATVASQTFGKDDGLPTMEYSGGLQAGGCRTSDGRLWFTSNKGLVSVDPAALPLNPVAPPVVVESIRVDGRKLESGGPGGLKPRLPPANERIEFQFTALSLTAPGKVLFKYRLHGLDKGWIEAGDRRVAFYSHLAPGDYRFQVIACNNDGLWNTTGDSIYLTVEPFYWQTWWFRISAVLLAVTGVSLIVQHETRRRMQLRLDQLEYERGIERERSRIAQDIHDDIGTSLTRITMLSQSSAEELSRPPQTAAVMKSIHATALDVTHTLDEIVWAVNPRHDSLDSLACYISRLAQETLAEAGIACRTNLPVHLPSWPLNAQLRHNLLLAFKEVLNNILKHARATEVHVTLVLQGTAFVLTVQDDGAGPEAGESNRALGGNGLDNVRRRLAQIGGRCEMHMAPGRGWCVVFTVEAPPSRSAVPFSSASSNDVPPAPTARD